MTGQEKEDILINYILKLFHSSELVQYETILSVSITYRDELSKNLVNEIDSQEIASLVFVMLNLDLISEHDSDNYKISEHGREIRREGGWLKYLKEGKEKKKREEEVVLATISSARHQKIGLWITVLVAVGTGLVQYFDYTLNEKAEVRATKQESRDTLLQAQQQRLLDKYYNLSLEVSKLNEKVDTIFIEP
ncbi:MAG: hypothetical protein KBB37_01440 [Bacteroidia bacterium]|nr:hypothetical protein [Bacteroidia bacterium]MBP7259923.1 hypothetical protein [Bacteroidia bacterium]MBP9725628.1 hypothetical protein [Bacteroidia bacterium]